MKKHHNVTKRPQVVPFIDETRHTMDFWWVKSFFIAKYKLKMFIHNILEVRFASHVLSRHLNATYSVLIAAI